MKRRTMILMLAALALFTQCKKHDANELDNGDGIQMVLKADNGASKTSFGANGSISWNTNEKIYVVTNGQCVGYVTNGTEGGSTFTGILTGIATDGTYDFHYYYVGNMQTIASGAASFTMDFSNQDGTLANLGNFHVGYGVQNAVEVTVNETVTAQASMQSLVAMAYFNTAGMAEAGEAVVFYGDNINNQMSIAFSGENANTPVFSKVNGGQICAGTATSGAYVMLLPNHTDGTELLDTDINFISKRTTGTCNDVFNYGIIGGRFYCNGGNTESPIPVTAASYEPGTLRGVFSIGENKTAHFSQGNLQYIGSAGNGDDNNTGAYWKFAENQKDYLGTTTGQNSSSSTVDRDLFGWGTSGYNHGAVAYQPWSTSTNYYDYYAYGADGNNLFDQTGQADWGYNAISNGGNAENCGWRTLTHDELVYILDTRTASTVNGTANAHYAYARVAGTWGIILFPDIYTHFDGVSQPTDINFNEVVDWDANDYTEEDFALLEANGAVFMPSAGYREGEGVNGVNGGELYYWCSSTPAYFAADGLYISRYLYLDFSFNRVKGCPVRLVRNAE